MYCELKYGESVRQQSTNSPRDLFEMRCPLYLSEAESSQDEARTQTPGSHLPHLITLDLHFLPKKLNTGPNQPGKLASGCLFVSLRVSYGSPYSPGSLPSCVPLHYAWQVRVQTLRRAEFNERQSRDDTVITACASFVLCWWWLRV